MRIALAKRGNDPGKVGVGERRQESDAEAPYFSAVHALSRLEPLLHIGQCCAGVPDELLAGRRERDEACATPEQLHADLALQRTNLLAERGL